MTYDDGILTVYRPQNTAGPGDQPQPGLTFRGRYYYSISSLGVTRYYAAMQAGQDVAAVVAVPGWSDIMTNDIVVLDEQPGRQYRADMVQPETDEMGLKNMRVTLGVLSVDYQIPTEDQGGAAYCT